MARPERVVQNYFGGRRPFVGTGNVEDYFGPQQGLVSPDGVPMPYAPVPGARTNFNPRGYTDLYMSPTGGGFSRGAAERLAQQSALEDTEDDLYAGQYAADEISQLDPNSGTYFSKDLQGILSRYPGAAGSKEVRDILNIQQVIQQGKDREASRKDPYLAKIGEPNHFRAYQERVNNGEDPKTAYASYLEDKNDEDLAYSLVDSGVPVADLDSYRGQNGRIDPLKAREAAFQFKQTKKELKSPRSLELKALDGLSSDLESVLSPSDSEKEKYITDNKLDPKNPAAWDRAFSELQKQSRATNADKIQEFEDNLRDMEDSGVRIPRNYLDKAAELGIELNQHAGQRSRFAPRASKEKVTSEVIETPNWDEAIVKEQPAAPLPTPSQPFINHPLPTQGLSLAQIQEQAVKAPEIIAKQQEEHALNEAWSGAKNAFEETLSQNPQVKQLLNGSTEGLLPLLRSIAKNEKIVVPVSPLFRGSGSELDEDVATGSGGVAKIDPLKFIADSAGIKLDAKVKIGKTETTNRELLKALALDRLANHGEANVNTTASKPVPSRDKTHLFE